MDEARILAIERPDKSLWTYYLLRCLIFPPLFPIVILPAWFRYHTMRYQLTTEGISMRWGILFRHEIILSYARIQDIHLRSNIIERWLGLARILIQTASGNAAAEMTIEGLKEFQQVRDFLYSKMRGVKEAAHHAGAAAPTAQASSTVDAGAAAELAAILREVKAEIRSLRETIETNRAQSGEGTRHV